jgi:hypothetical protein
LNDDHRAAMTSPSLHTIAPDALRFFASKAMTTWGDIDDCKLFLPKIFALAGSENDAHWIGFDLTLIARKLLLADFASWLADERRAGCDDFEALWHRWTNADAHADDADDWLEAVLELAPVDPALTAIADQIRAAVHPRRPEANALGCRR